MRIIIPTFEEIKLMPPTITLFYILSEMGYEVVYLTIFPDEYESNFIGKNIKNTSLVSKNYTLKRWGYTGIPGVRGLLFRIDNVIKSLFAHRLSAWLSKNLKEDDLLWVVNEMTPILAGSSFAKKYKDRYIFTIYELHNANWTTRNIKNTAKNAKITVVPEYNRAHMQKYFFGMKKLPLILPNKSIDVLSGKDLLIENESIRNKIQEIKSSGKKIILYMGIIGEERPLDKIIEAVNLSSDKYELVVLGRPSLYLEFLQKKYRGQFTYLGFVMPPQHINIASHADIGVIIYVPQGNIGLNALYCAPNKIYEYTGLGLPVIANDIPGLTYFVKKYNCGVSIDLDNPEDIKNKLSELLKNYDEYQKGALRLYSEVDIKKIVDGILQQYQNN